MKDTPKFTPGPWSRCPARNGKCSCGQIFSEKSGENVATIKNVIGCVHGEWGDDSDMIYGEVPPEESLANSYLIASSPLLYMALWAQEVLEEISLSKRAKLPMADDHRYTQFIGEWNGRDGRNARFSDFAQKVRELRTEALKQARGEL